MPYAPPTAHSTPGAITTHCKITRYSPFGPQQPLAALRLGIVRYLRGEFAAAERAFRRAQQGALRPRDAELTSIYLAATLDAQGKVERAARLYTQLQSCAAHCFFAGSARC
ncbi:hypothetical protein HC891_25705 [Candidatus Gracilibacteria bacterium]|nr:hypothetical protein [Candidatus Gracilibacteria bacterium]